MGLFGKCRSSARSAAFGLVKRPRSSGKHEGGTRTVWVHPARTAEKSAVSDGNLQSASRPKWDRYKLFAAVTESAGPVNIYSAHESFSKAFFQSREVLYYHLHIKYRHINIYMYICVCVRA